MRAKVITFLEIHTTVTYSWTGQFDTLARWVTVPPSTAVRRTPPSTYSCLRCPIGSAPTRLPVATHADMLESTPSWFFVVDKVAPMLSINALHLRVSQL